MKALHKLIEERVKPNFTGDGKLKRFWVVFDSLETFLFTPGHTTAKGVHVRDGIDLKRTMFLVIVAMLPALLFGTWNIGHQYFRAWAKSRPLMRGARCSSTKSSLAQSKWSRSL